MANIKELIQSIESPDSSFDEKLAAINEMQSTLVAMQEHEQDAIDENVGLIIEAIKVMEKKVADQLEIAKSIVPEKGDKGDKGQDGIQGKDGTNGRDGRDGKDGLDGKDGEDGVSVTDAKIDFDGSLIITLSTGREINVGEVVAPDLAERIKVISTMSTNTAIAAITGGTIDNTVIGGTTPAAGTFTTLTNTSTATLGGDATAPALVAVASAGNTRWLTVTGSSAAGVNLNIAGAGNGNLILIPRGTGGTLIASGASSSNVQFAATHTASAVNYVQVTGAATTATPQIVSAGSDTNVNLAISSKGTGSLNFYTNSVNANSNHLNITHTGSVVNRFQLTGAQTGFGVTLSVNGSDTNISQVFQSKGTGAIDLAAGSSGVNISNGGTVTAITGTATGTLYTSIPSVAISAPTTAGGVQATASAQMQLLVAAIAGGGTGYTAGDTLTVVGGTGSAATLTVSTVSSGVITAIAGGSGGTYSVLPTNPVSVTGGTGSGATFNVTSYGVRTTAFTITNAGSGYVEQPTVSFSGGGGSGAAAYATVGSSGKATSIGNTLDFYGAGGVAFRTTTNHSGTTQNYWIANGTNIAPSLTASTNTGAIIGTSTANPVQFTTNNGTEQFRVAHTASAVNYVQVTGAATGAAPTISAQGSDAAVGLTFNTKSTGVHTFQTNGTTRLLINSGGTVQMGWANATPCFTTIGVSSQVNGFQVSGSVAGSAPSLSSTGTDTNIDLTLTPKGTGVIQFGTYTASVLTPTGYITIKTSDGTTRRLLVG